MLMAEYHSKEADRHVQFDVDACDVAHESLKTTKYPVLSVRLVGQSRQMSAGVTPTHLRTWLR
jgi:hypothetical protein